VLIKKVWKLMHSSKYSCAESGKACKTALLLVLQLSCCKSFVIVQHPEQSGQGVAVCSSGLTMLPAEQLLSDLEHFLCVSFWQACGSSDWWQN